MVSASTVGVAVGVEYTAPAWQSLGAGVAATAITTAVAVEVAVGVGRVMTCPRSLQAAR